MTDRNLWVALLALLITSCTVQENIKTEVHGHRGSRGLMPENTIPAFLRALDLGCDYIEMDVVLTKDHQVVISHEPWMEPSICLDPNGRPIADGRAHNIHRMTLAEVKRYDCGSLGNERFPEQEHLVAFKPSLREMVEAADEHALLNGLVSPSYNIEIKSDPAWYGEFQPQPEDYVKAVIATIDSIGLADRCIIQSFDTAILEAVHEQAEHIRLALLVENKDGLKKNLARLSFRPQIYSPWYGLVDKALVKEVREMDMELLVWTVNDPADIERMLDLGVNGIISDHPERVIRSMEERQ